MVGVRLPVNKIDLTSLLHHKLISHFRPIHPRLPLRHAPSQLTRSGCDVPGGCENSECSEYRVSSFSRRLVRGCECSEFGVSPSSRRPARNSAGWVYRANANPEKTPRPRGHGLGQRDGGRGGHFGLNSLCHKGVRPPLVDLQLHVVKS